MIQDAQNLATFIEHQLHTHRTCRIYQDALNAVWYAPSAGDRAEREAIIQRFAADYGWTVEIHTPGHYGPVADFALASYATEPAALAAA